VALYLRSTVFLDGKDLIKHNNIFVFNESLTLRKVIFGVNSDSLRYVGTHEDGLNSV